jgi:hypothetical protein
LVASSPSTGIVGGIDRATWTFWQNQAYGAVTNGGSDARLPQQRHFPAHPGSTMGAANFTQVQLQKRPRGARFSHVHRNVPETLRRLKRYSGVTSIFSRIT